MFCVMPGGRGPEVIPAHAFGSQSPGYTRLVLRRPLETAPPTAAAGAAGMDLRGHKLAVRLFSHGEDAVANLKVFQGDGLASLY